MVEVAGCSVQLAGTDSFCSKWEEGVLVCAVLTWEDFMGSVQPNVNMGMVNRCTAHVVPFLHQCSCIYFQDCWICWYFAVLVETVALLWSNSRIAFLAF